MFLIVDPTLSRSAAAGHWCADGESEEGAEGYHTNSSELLTGAEGYRVTPCNVQFLNKIAGGFVLIFSSVHIAQSDL